MTKRSTYFHFVSQRIAGGGIAVFKEIWNGLGKVGETSCFYLKAGFSNAQRDFRPLSRESV